MISNLEAQLDDADMSIDYRELAREMDKGEVAEVLSEEIDYVQLGKWVDVSEVEVDPSEILDEMLDRLKR